MAASEFHLSASTEWERIGEHWMPYREVFSRGLVVFVAISLCLGFLGCTPAEETAIITQLQTALNSLQQNRALTEQFVRDIKATVSPADPGYVQAMESYQDARESYDHFLDGVETNGRSMTTRSMRLSGPTEVRNAAADFLADATSVLKPDVNTRRIPFQRAIVIPDDLQAALQKLPKHSREKLINQFDDQIRWRSWGQL